jgi:hypothetical protein
MTETGRGRGRGRGTYAQIDNSLKCEAAADDRATMGRVSGDRLRYSWRKLVSSAGKNQSRHVISLGRKCSQDALFPAMAYRLAIHHNRCNGRQVGSTSQHSRLSLHGNVVFLPNVGTRDPGV